MSKKKSTTEPTSVSPQKPGPAEYWQAGRALPAMSTRLEHDLIRAHFLAGESGPQAKRRAEEDYRRGVDTGSGTRSDRLATASAGPDYSTPPTIDCATDPVLRAMSRRRSISKVGPETPSDSDLREMIRAVSSAADHKGLRPWRVLIIRGDDRLRLGEALDEAAAVTREPGDVNPKPLRAELLLALVACPKPHPKVPEWEQQATAAGIGHLLELVLWETGWGAMWRSGNLANEPAVRRMHGLAENELLMGWLYIGSIPDRYRERLATSTRPLPDPERFLDTV